MHNYIVKWAESLYTGQNMFLLQYWYVLLNNVNFASFLLKYMENQNEVTHYWWYDC